jgi:surfeit locus 1 family protein
VTIQAGPGQEPRPARIGFILLVVLGVCVLTALGVWQLERRVWKLDLIRRVDERVRATPAPAPGPADWADVTAVHDEYRHVRVSGRFLNDRETLVQAVTDLGGGYWLLTPLRTDQGFTVLVNRGFIPSELKDPAVRAGDRIAGETTVTGLLRMTEPKGGFLRANDPVRDLWRSRDVRAIAAARGLSETAPYFIDAELGPDPQAYPRGGLTVLTFANSHLIYALTWFGMAVLLAGAAIATLRPESRKSRARTV